MNPLWQPAPIDPSWITEGDPRAMIYPIANDGCVSTGYWQCTRGCFTWHYDVNETIVFLSGLATIDGARMAAGSTRVFARGSSAKWVVFEPVTKIYVIERRKPLLRRVLGALKRRFLGS